MKKRKRTISRFRQRVLKKGVLKQLRRDRYFTKKLNKKASSTKAVRREMLKARQAAKMR